MNLIDMHCDTISKIYKGKGSIGLYNNEFCVDIKKLRKANAMAQFFAAFIDDVNEDTKGLSCFLYIKDMIDRLYLEVGKNPNDLGIVKSYEDLIINRIENRISVVIAVENGAVIGRDIHKLWELYELGVRLMTLTWNHPNSIGFPSYKSLYLREGLTSYGKAVVQEMNELGMIIDVSHLSDQGVLDAIDISKDPIIASHSNARAICNHPRNLSDEMIKGIANTGGIIGINFYPKFLGNKDVGKLEDILKHIEYIKKVGGMDVLGIGTDFDGFKGNCEIENIGQIGKLIEGLESKGYGINEIEKICYKNACRVFREVVG